MVPGQILKVDCRRLLHGLGDPLRHDDVEQRLGELRLPPRPGRGENLPRSLLSPIELMDCPLAFLKGFRFGNQVVEKVIFDDHDEEFQT